MTILHIAIGVVIGVVGVVVLVAVAWWLIVGAAFKGAFGPRPK